MSFTAQIIKSRHHLIRLVTGTNGGKPAWWIVNVNPQKFELFKIKLAEGINLDNYGEVIHKGWGATAPDHIMKMVEEQYS